MSLYGLSRTTLRVHRTIKFSVCQFTLLNRLSVVQNQYNIPATFNSKTVAFNRMAHTDFEIPDFDKYRRNSTKNPCKDNRSSFDTRASFTSINAVILTIASVVGAKSVVHMFILSMAASKDVLALAKIEVNLADVPEGRNVTFKWRGKPLFIKHRTQLEIDRERETDISTLRDPERDEDRVKNPSFLVVLGVCTHLGCVPIPNMGDFPGGYYCPCHGSHYDGSGRIRKGPAPLNLEVPVHDFVGDTIVIG